MGRNGLHFSISGLFHTKLYFLDDMRFLEELDNLVLPRLSWEEAVREMESRLSQDTFLVFQRLHRSFVHYRSPRNVEKFYGFIYMHGLQDLLLRFRRPRLEQIGIGFFQTLGASRSVLEIGAGTGIWGELLRRVGPEVDYAAYDACQESREFMRARGFKICEPDPERAQFEILLCADSLGEENADEDDWLTEPSHQARPDFPDIFEERYGIIAKLKPWKAHLKPGGRVLLWEPFPARGVFQAIRVLLQRDGWEAFVREAGDTAFIEARSEPSR